MSRLRCYSSSLGVMLALLCLCFECVVCVVDGEVTDVEVWLTTADQSILFQQQPISDNRHSSTALKPPATRTEDTTIVVDEEVWYQAMAGFGYCMTCGSASLLFSLPEQQRISVLNELFADCDYNSSSNHTCIGVSFLRLNLGASDMCDHAYTYDDMPEGQTDPSLAHFSIECEREALIPLLLEILSINPALPILATPWSAPAWMKNNSDLIGGSLMQQYFEVYANYFVMYIQAMSAEGIPIAYVTPQNEPLNDGNNPSMVMEAGDEDTFIKKYLGPAFVSAGISTKIIIYDHNCDRPDYPEYILADPDALPYIDGSAFHLYAGNVSAMSYVKEAQPDKSIYFTEQYTPGPGDFGGDLDWSVQYLVIGAPHNWARTVLLWNLAADATYGPHTPGGCTTCLGAVTVQNTTVTRNVGYYIIAHASKFVRPGWLRVESTDLSSVGLPNVAFASTADNRRALVVLNTASNEKTFLVDSNGSYVTTVTIPPSAVVTVVWTSPPE